MKPHWTLVFHIMHINTSLIINEGETQKSREGLEGSRSRDGEAAHNSGEFESVTDVTYCNLCGS